VVLLLLIALLAPFRIDAGPYAGALRLAPTGAVNWYFATTSLLRLRRLPLPETRAYLDAYLEHLDPLEGIADVLPMPTGVYAPIAPDSEDAYAGTILSLAVRYRSESHDSAWWQASVPTLSAIAYAKLLTQFKPDGLIRASRTDATGYLMDNVEDYDGLRAFASALTITHAADARYVSAFVAPLGDAIHGLYDESAQAFRWSDSGPIGPLVPYPSCAAQLYPQLYNVTTGHLGRDLDHWAGARQTAARCHFSLATDPHEALLYAVFIKALPEQSHAERSFIAHVRAHAPHDGDLVTMSLLDALSVSQK
jgi:hypothetical protein